MNETSKRLDSFFEEEAKRWQDPMLQDLPERTERAYAYLVQHPELRGNYLSALTIVGDIMTAERSDRMVKFGIDAEDAYVFVGSFARFDWVVKQYDLGNLKREWVLSMLPDLWRGADPDDTDERYLSLWYEAWEANGNKPVLDGPDLPEGFGTDEVLTVYRGQLSMDDPIGIAWSLQRQTARKFAHGAGIRQSGYNGVLLTAEVKRRDVLAYLTGRNEAECICDPDTVRVFNYERVSERKRGTK